MRVRRFALWAVAVAVVLAGCGGDDTEAQLAEQEARIAELEAQLAAALTTTTTSSTTTTSTTGTTTTTTTTTTVPEPTEEELAAAEYEADVQLIKDLWRDYSDSWGAGLENATRFIAYNNYPFWPWSSAECLAFYRDVHGWRDGYTDEAIVQADTIERADNWRIPAGDPHAGETPEGRTYVMTVDYDRWIGYDHLDTAEVHVTIYGTHAYFFIPCER